MKVRHHKDAVLIRHRCLPSKMRRSAIQSSLLVWILLARIYNYGGTGHMEIEGKSVKLGYASFWFR